MAKRRSYKQDERILTRILLADVAVFALYLLFAGLGVSALKAVTAIIAIIGSLLCLGYLFMRGEIAKLRSRWMVMGYGAIVLLILVSLLLKYPAPSVKAADSGSKTSTSASADATGTTDASDATDASVASDAASDTTTAA